MKYRIFSFLLILVFISCENDNTSAPPTPEAALEQLVSDFENQTGIQIFYKPGTLPIQQEIENNHSVTADDYSHQPAQFLLEEIKEFIDLFNGYPVGFINDLDLDAILFVEKEGVRWAGRAARFTYSSMAFNQLNSFADPVIVAHELFHIFDPISSAGIVPTNSLHENDWSELNPPGFSYNSTNCSDACGGSALKFSPGFANNYAKCNPREDRAVIFSFMYTQSAGLKSALPMNPILSTKVDFIEDLVTSYDFTF